MILIGGTSLVKEDLPNHEVLDYQIEDKNLGVKLKIAAGPVCLKIYLREDLRSEYTITSKIEKKLIFFKDDDELITLLGGKVESEETDEIAKIERELEEKAAKLAEQDRLEAERLEREKEEEERLERERERLAKEKAELEEQERLETERLAKEKAELEEQIAKEKAEKERLAKEKAEKERIEKERLEQERIAKEKAEKERIEKERQEQERIAKEKAEQERLEQERLEKERLEKERLEKERLEKERLEQERLEKERLEQERLEQERVEQERLEKERLEKERLEKERLEQERLEKERLEQERLEQERIEQERLEKERLEKERLEQERLEQERVEQERLEQERLEQERIEKERIEQERLEQERIEQERIEQERLEQERIEQERLEQERLEQERLEKEKLEQERLEQERLEQERLEQERIEQERIEQERLEQERLEQERIEKEKLEQERLEQERLEQERLEQEKADQETEEEIVDVLGSIDKSVFEIPEVESVEELKQRLEDYERIIRQKEVMLEEKEKEIEVGVSVQESLVAKLKLDYEEKIREERNKRIKLEHKLEETSMLDVDMSLVPFSKYAKSSDSMVLRDGFTASEKIVLGQLKSKHTILAIGPGRTFSDITSELEKGLMGMGKEFLFVDVSNDPTFMLKLQVKAKVGAATINMLKDEKSLKDVVYPKYKTLYMPASVYDDIGLLTVDWAKKIREIDDFAGGRPVIYLFNNIQSFAVKHTVSKLASVMNMWVFSDGMPATVILTALTIRKIPKDRYKMVIFGYKEVTSLEQTINQLGLSEVRKYGLKEPIKWNQLNLM